MVMALHQPDPVLFRTRRPCGLLRCVIRSVRCCFRNPYESSGVWRDGRFRKEDGHVMEHLCGWRTVWSPYFWCDQYSDAWLDFCWVVCWYVQEICVLFTPTNEFRLTARHGRIRLHGKRSINIYLPLYGARPSHWQGVTLALAIALIIRRPRIPSSKYFNLQFAMHLMHDICLCNTHHHPQISD
jgi:hypothetical protein